MKIPPNISREHLLKAIDKIDIEGIPTEAQSKQYDVIFNGKKYPPKLIVSYSNIYANNSELDRNSFEGGEKTAAFKLLRKHDFVIKPKMTTDFFPVLIKFLEQANTHPIDLKIRSYPKEYDNLKVKVSFGQAVAAEIPWIAFMRNNQSASKGIYPVYLYFRIHRLLILAYGISETNNPDVNWEINANTVNEIIKVKKLKKVKRYGSSLVYKIYELDLDNENFSLDKAQINTDLSAITNYYKNVPLKNNAEVKHLINISPFESKLFEDAADQANLILSTKMAARFVSSLCTKPFVILTGLSGSGKTKLAQTFVNWICEDESQFCLLPVGADWTNREPILGFPSALSKNEYVKPDNKALDLIIKANKDSQKPYFLILDEMNLSHVERYFADFLSVMESGNSICLHSGSSDRNNVPSEVRLPSNLFIIGTVNIDETTYMFSPKVLDRASVIEFRVTADEMESYLKNRKILDLESIRSLGSNNAQDFLRIATEKDLQIVDTDKLNKSLISFFKELKKAGAEFGYRSAAEIIRFASIANTTKTGWEMSEIIDIAILQKLLPKVHGSRRKLESILETLGDLCLIDNKKFIDFVKIEDDLNLENVSIKYPLSFEKILRMYHNLLKNGFTSYAEA